MDHAISYQVSLSPKTRYFHIVCIIQAPDKMGQVLYLPTWLPGSYMIRDFAKQLIALKAYTPQGECLVEKIDKTSWRVAPCEGPLSVSYSIYANDASPRGAYLDCERGFFNGSRIFLCVSGQEDVLCQVDVHKPNEVAKGWQLATSMMSVNPHPFSQFLYFGSYCAQNYAELIDHPFELGRFERHTFYVRDLAHELVVSGQHSGDITQVISDLSKICEHFIQLFGVPKDLNRYVFLLNVVHDGYGGLEHRASCALITSRYSLPAEPGLRDVNYQSLLGLMAHEYFHLWNIKRIKPEVFMEPNLRQEVYTRQLWIFEGFTAYYDELALVRTGLIGTHRYFELLSENINKLMNTPGRYIQSLEESSFDAWIKFYKPDENSINSTVSYYLKGSLLALCLDLSLRLESKHSTSLDTVMQALWQRFGCIQKGVPEGALPSLILETTHCDMTSRLQKWVSTTEDLPLAPLLAEFGLDLRVQSSILLKFTDLLGVKLKADGLDACISAVLSGGAAESAELLVNDVLVAVNELKVDKMSLEAPSQFGLEQTVKIHFFRDKILRMIKVKLSPLIVNQYSVQRSLNQTSEQSERCLAWLHTL